MHVHGHFNQLETRRHGANISRRQTHGIQYNSETATRLIRLGVEDRFGVWRYFNRGIRVIEHRVRAELVIHTDQPSSRTDVEDRLKPDLIFPFHVQCQ